MRHVLIMAAAAAMLLAPIANAAQGRGHHGRGEGRGRAERIERDRGGEYRGNRQRGAEDRYRYREREPDPYEGRGRYVEPDEERLPRYEPNPDIRRRQDPRNALPPLVRDDPRGRGYQRSWGRGERLPPMYRGGVVRDPGRLRLRTPPPGYDWVGVGPDVYLVERNSGLVLDAIPEVF